MDKRTIYLTGEARTSLDNAITRIYGIFYIAFELTRDGEIVDVDCNATLSLTRNFIKKLFMAHKFTENDQIEADINARYFGTSSKAIIAAYHDALQRYKQMEL
jgi:hypothetical protein